MDNGTVLLTSQNMKYGSIRRGTPRECCGGLRAPDAGRHHRCQGKRATSPPPDDRLLALPPAAQVTFRSIEVSICRKACRVSTLDTPPCSSHLGSPLSPGSGVMTPVFHAREGDANRHRGPSTDRNGARASQCPPEASSTGKVIHGARAKASAITAYPMAHGQAGASDSTVSAAVQR